MLQLRRHGAQRVGFDALVRRTAQDSSDAAHWRGFRAWGLGFRKGVKEPRIRGAKYAGSGRVPYRPVCSGQVPHGPSVAPANSRRIQPARAAQSTGAMPTRPIAWACDYPQWFPGTQHHDPITTCLRARLLRGSHFSAQRLARRADVRTALADAQRFDWRSALPARFARPAIHIQMPLHAAAEIHPVDRGSVLANRLAQHYANRPPQRTNLLLRKFITPRQRMQSGPKQRFVGVNIADPGDNRLVQQQRLEQPPASTQHAAETCHGEPFAERLDAQLAKPRRSNPSCR